MTKVRRYFETEEIKNWKFNTEEEAQKYIDERIENRLEGYADSIYFTMEKHNEN